MHKLLARVLVFKLFKYSGFDSRRIGSQLRRSGVSDPFSARRRNRELAFYVKLRLCTEMFFIDYSANAGLCQDSLVGCKAAIKGFILMKLGVCFDNPKSVMSIDKFTIETEICCQWENSWLIL